MLIFESIKAIKRKEANAKIKISAQAHLIKFYKTHGFKEKGEEYFRKKETQYLKYTTNLQNTIIACGGGTPCFHNNLSWINH